jgi:hypothetical protein
MALNCEMNERNKIIEIGKKKVPILRYSIGIINWNWKN